MPKISNAPAGPRIVALAYDGLCTFEFSCAYEVFGLPRPEMGSGWYRFSVAAGETGTLRAAGGLIVSTDAGLEALGDAELIIVPGWRGVEQPVPRPIAAAIAAAASSGARVASLCSGVFVLEAAGLLDGRRATTHWRYADALKARNGSIRVEPDVLYVDEGDVLTAAGSAAGIDLCLHIVRRDFGPAAANSVARRLVVPPHRDGGQAQFIQRPVPTAHEGARLGRLLDWMRNHLGEEMPIPALAARAGMSPRTFQRRFRETTGLPPGEWLAAERVARAMAMLEADRCTVDLVAATVGFGSVAALRHHFKRLSGISPAAYRSRFAGG